MAKKKLDPKEELKEYIESTKSHARGIPGRMTTLNWELLTNIRALIFEGQFQKYIAAGFGIPIPTWNGWKAKGNELLNKAEAGEIKFEDFNENEEMYAYLSYLCETGKAKAIQRHHRTLNEDAKVDSRTAMWFLKIYGREEYAPPERFEGKVDAVVTTDEAPDFVQFREEMIAAINSGKAPVTEDEQSEEESIE